MNPAESQHLEYKRELSDGLEREVVAFLNHRDGGRILIGVDDAGAVVGLSNPDGDQLKIKDRLKQNIQPSCLGLFDVLLEEAEGKQWIKLIVASGSEKPYYVRKQGMSPRGCFIRIGSAVEPMPERMIEQLFATRTRNSIGRITAPRQDLSFTQLKIYYEGVGRPLGPQFARTLELRTEEGAYNYAAYLLADQNNTSVKVAKYAGTDRVDLTENEEYGNCCLIKATHQVLNRLEVENRTLARITSKQREEQRLYDAVALREAVINALVHNDYSYDGVPKFEIFADRLEITSTGGVPQGLSEDEFFEGYSMPRNKELMRIFRDLEMVEYLGSGIPRILKAYSKEAFRFTENFTRMRFASAEPSVGEPSETVSETTQKATQKTAQKTPPETPPETLPETLPTSSGKTPSRVLAVLRESPEMTLEDASVAVGKSLSAVKRAVAKLTQAGKLRYVGPKKGGHWEVLEQ